MAASAVAVEAVELNNILFFVGFEFQAVVDFMSEGVVDTSDLVVLDQGMLNILWKCFRGREMDISMIIFPVPIPYVMEYRIYELHHWGGGVLNNGQLYVQNLFTFYVMI